MIASALSDQERCIHISASSSVTSEQEPKKRRVDIVVEPNNLHANSIDIGTQIASTTSMIKEQMLPIEDAKEHGEEGNVNDEKSDTCETEVPASPEHNMVGPQFTPDKTSAETPDYRFPRAICDDADASIDASADIASRGCSAVERLSLIHI